MVPNLEANLESYFMKQQQKEFNRKRESVCVREKRGHYNNIIIS